MFDVEKSVVRSRPRSARPTRQLGNALIVVLHAHPSTHAFTETLPLRVRLNVALHTPTAFSPHNTPLTSRETLPNRFPYVDQGTITFRIRE